MRTERIQVRVFIEGVYVPHVSSVTVQSFANESSVANITLPPPPGFRFENLKRARVHIFWSDIDIRSSRSDNEWPLLFEGEITGDSYVKGVGQRNLNFRCSGYNTYWEQVLLYYWNPQSGGTPQTAWASKVSMLLGNKQIDIDAPISGANTISRAIQEFNAKDEGGDDKPYYSIVKSIFSSSLTTNHFFEQQNEKLKLDGRFVAVQDPNIEVLVNRDYVVKLLENDIFSASGRTSMMEILKRILSVFRYSIIANPQPLYLSRSSDNDAIKRLNAIQAKILTERVVNRWSSFLFESGMTNVEINATDFVERLTPMMSEDDVRQLAIDVDDEFRRIGVKAIARTSTAAKTDEAAGKNLTNKDRVEDFIKLLSAELNDINAGSEPAKAGLDKDKGTDNPSRASLETVEGIEDLVAQYLLVPDTRFAGIPRCNTIFPQDQTSLSISRQLLAEPTRSISSAFAQAGGVHRLYAAPRQLGFATVPQKVFAPVAEGGTVYPVPGKTRISSGFGPRQITKKVRTGTTTSAIKHPSGPVLHPGVDIASVKGNPIRGKPALAWDSGRVTHADYQNPSDHFEGGGLYVSIWHGNGLRSLYMHLDAVTVKVGDEVVAGEQIGVVGNTGSSTGAHLHFEIRRGKEAVNPEKIGANGQSFLGAAQRFDSADLVTEATGTEEPQEVEVEGEKIEDGAKKGDEEFEDFKYLTPEEELSGIIPYFDDMTVRTHSFIEFGRGTTNEQGVVDRDTYTSQLVESEFLWRRAATRSIDAINTPFNPRPVAGFPGLVVDRVRSVIGLITSITHSISVGGGSGNASTSISMEAPRFWDEGDPYYWVRGEERLDAGGLPDASVANFPSYLNTGLVPTNSTDRDIWDAKEIKGLEKEFAGKPQPIDLFYQTILGVNAIPYAYGQTEEGDTPIGTSVSFNKAIDGPDRELGGNRYPNTIVGQYYDRVDRKPAVAEDFVNRFTHRPAINESELMTEVLQAEPAGGLGYKGGPFNDKLRSEVQKVNLLLGVVNAQRG